MATSARPVAPSKRRGEGKGKQASKSRPVEGVGARLELRRALLGLADILSLGSRGGKYWLWLVLSFLRAASTPAR